MEQKFKAEDKSSWTSKNANAIATEFGYVPDQNFLAALEGVIRLAQEAQCVDLLKSVVQGMFRNWSPPLERLPTQSTLSKQIVLPLVNSLQQNANPPKNGDITFGQRILGAVGTIFSSKR